MSIRRRMTAVLSSAAVAAGVLVGATPATAVPLTATITPSSGTTNQIVVEFSSIPAAGEVRLCTDLSMSASDCASDSTGPNVYYIGVPSSTTVNVEIGTSVYDLYTHGYVSLAAGTYLVVAADISYSLASATLTLGSSMSSGPTDRALVYPTATFDPNGGSCPDNQQTQFINGGDADPNALTPMGCSRDGYRLAGWAYSRTATDRDFPDSMMIPIGDESFTLYAVWVPTGIEVTYDANVGTDVACMAGGSSTDVRTSTVVAEPGWEAASTAPCAPAGMVFAGWAIAGDGDVAVQPGATLPSDWTRGSSHRLYAKWQVTYELSLSQVSQEVAPASTPSVTLTATRNGQPAVGATIAYRWTGEDEFGSFAMDPQTVTLNDLGAATVRMGANVGSEGFATITAAYGDTTASASFTVVQPVITSITITGERGTVKGKPGITIDGLTTGFAEGAVVVPYIRFPGQTAYSAGSARPTVDADGDFSWQRKTGKKIYLYFTNEDGTVRSNRIIIQAK